MSDKRIAKIIDLKERFASLNELTKRKLILLEELEASSIHELCDYDLRPQADNKKAFFLFDISTKKMVADGSSFQITKWLDRRSIDSNLVFNYELINPKI